MDSAAIEPFVFCRLPVSAAPQLPEVSCVEAEFNAGTVSVDTMHEFDIDPPVNFSNMLSKRRSEYLAGRLCARFALRSAGSRSPGQVSSLPDRSPVWPEGWIGSISHCSGQAVAVAAPARPVRRLGVDVEGVMSENAASELADNILFPADRLEQTQPFGVALTIVFSAKEALFKAIYCDVKRFFGFEAAAVISYGNGSLRLQLMEDLSDRWRRGEIVNVRWSLSAERVYSLVYVEAP